MANYNAFIRTNYFRVTDEARFKEIIDNCSCEDSLDIFQDNDKSDMFAFGCYGSIFGISPEQEGDGSELDEDINLFFMELQTILPEGEAIIFTEIGYEKLRYLIAYAVVITKDSIVSVDLREESMKLAAKSLGVERYETNDQY